MKEGINVLSLFDGMSCGQIALNRQGIKVNKYYASEVDKYAIKVTMANYPNTIQLGDVRTVNPEDLDFIDLVIGGSPCQSFSFAGKRNGMSTKCEIEILTLEKYLELKAHNFEFEGQSYLFWEYIRVLQLVKRKNPNVKFLLENVMMGSKWQKILTQAIGINPICINSSLVSAQNRERLYWTNIASEPDGLFGDCVCKITQPKDKGLLIRDVLEDNPDDKYFLGQKMINWLNKHGEKRGVSPKFLDGNQQSGCLTATAQTKGNLSTDYIVQDKISNREPLQINPSKEAGGQPSIQNRVYDINGVAPAVLSQMSGGSYAVLLNDRQQSNYKDIFDKSHTLLSTMWKGSQANGMTLVGDNRIRRLTPIECERLQTVPDNYTNYVSDSQRYRMLGNGWTIDVISHIFSFL